MLTLTVDDGRVLDADFVPARIDGAGLPQRLTGAEAEQAEADFAALRSCTDLADSPT